MSENVEGESVGVVEEIAVAEEREAAVRRLAEVLSPAAIESLVKDAETSRMGLDGPRACSTK
ncbi:hypothetical protein GCM10022222_38450 [Amycolatopsis ultiminotia]|uniref:FXSXX-COOH protein n=1 Tax=Amycolatopsis ultiminotia TaxID=543629 RepID=A0ABP6WKS0_9PSEU